MAFRLILHQQTIAYSQRQAILIFHLHERLKSFSQKNLSFTVFPLISVSYPAFSYLSFILYLLLFENSWKNVFTFRKTTSFEKSNAQRIDHCKVIWSLEKETNS